jgi:hypothetical protein
LFSIFASIFLNWLKCWIRTIYFKHWVIWKVKFEDFLTQPQLEKSILPCHI